MSEKSTCPKETAENGPSLFQNGNLVFQAHHVGWIVSAFFTIVATITSFWLVNKHLQWYTNKREQRYIVRILFMVPIYATISLASYLFWNHSTPLLLIRDAYESTVLTSFFYLLLMYISPNPDEQRAVFAKVGLSRQADQAAKRKGEDLKKWVFPLGFIKWKPRDGLLFLQLMKWGVLQYCVLRPLTTLAAVILDYAGLYCEASWGIGWGHIYITIIVSLSVTIAMYCLIQLYMPVAEILKPQKPLLKLFAIKAVVFLTFWQATFLAVLSMFGVVKDTKYMTAEDINIGFGALLETFEMMLFGFLHVKAFTYKVYRPHHNPGSKDPPPERTPRLRSLGHAMDFRETFRELRTGWIYIFHRLRGKEPTVDINANRLGHYESAFGKARPSGLSGRELSRRNEEKDYPTLPAAYIDVERTVDIEGERQWLGVGNDYGYGIHREKSDGLEEQIERELERRGFGGQIPGRGHIKPLPTNDTPNAGHKAQRSWWRNIYNRVSQSGAQSEIDEEQRLSVARDLKTRKSRHKSRSRRQSRDGDVDTGLLYEYDYDIDEPPPQSLVRQYRGRVVDEHGVASRGSADNNAATRNGREDLLSPLSVFIEHTSSKTSKQRNINSMSKNLAEPRTADLNTNRRTANIAQAGSSNLNSPPPSSLLLAPMGPASSNDSLFGRVFPHSTDHGLSTEQGHTNAGVAPAQSRHMHSPPPRSIGAQSYEIDIGMAGERSMHLSQVEVAQPIQSQNGHLTPGLEIADPIAQYNAEFDRATSQGSHRRESAFHRPTVPSHPPDLSGPPPFLTASLETTSPVALSPVANTLAGPKPPPPSAISTPGMEHRDYEAGAPQPRPRGLRRSSAQLYTSQSPPCRRPRQLTMPPLLQTNTVQAPQRTHRRQSNERPHPDHRRNDIRRTSAPIDVSGYLAHPSYPRPSHSTRHSMDNTLVRPVLIGTPTPYSDASEQRISSHDLSRYPGTLTSLPSPGASFPAPRDVQAESRHWGQGGYSRPILDSPRRSGHTTPNSVSPNQTRPWS